jgi:hypothetical protein
VNDIRTKRWGDCYKRVVVLDTDLNNGVAEAPIRLCTGDGEVSPLMIGTESVGIHGISPLFFGTTDVYMKKSADGTLKIGAARLQVNGVIIGDVIDVHTVSAQNIKSFNRLSVQVASFREIKADTAIINQHTFNTLDVSVLDSCSLNVRGRAVMESVSIESGLEGFMAWDEY